MDPVRLTQLTRAGRRGAKFSPGVLGALLARLSRVQNPNLPVGHVASAATVGRMVPQGRHLVRVLKGR